MAGSSATSAIAAEGGARASNAMRLAQVTVREQVIIRVQTQPQRRSPQTLAATNKVMPPASAIKWKEKKAPRCIPLKSLAGASVTKRDSVDIVLRGGTRMRAKLGNDCPALDFYDGFYIKPTQDGQMCAERDTIHSRSGGQCEISRFRTLVPDR
ncbi:hypothetical protein D3876_11760 [Sphingomonas cavernae]|uniref:Uncharacterized protein n=2 Tax=Sphingomonas cavernae TaxID=2320861 RepID=A0A418WLF0_9SPHN|nr:hypothetical protein D3876_11760 [Sphingomonas cavernae]